MKNKATIDPYVFIGLQESQKEFIKKKFDTVELLIKDLCNEMCIDFDLLMSSFRGRQVTNCRRIIVIFLRNYSKLTLNEIATFINRADHSTIINLLTTHDDFMKYDANYRDYFNQIELKFDSNYIYENYGLKRYLR